jgi:hypothetical protein
LVRGEGSGGINEACLLKCGKLLVDHLIGSTSIALTIKESMLKNLHQYQRLFLFGVMGEGIISRIDLYSSHDYILVKTIFTGI